MTEIMKLAINDEISPRMDLNKDPDAIASIMFSNQKVVSMDPSREAEMLMPKEECPRVKDIAGKIRKATDANGKPVSKMKMYNICDGLFEPIIDKFYDDPTLIAYGEDNRDWGGAFGVYKKTDRGCSLSPILQLARSPSRLSSVRLSATQCAAAALSSSLCTPTSSAARATRSSTRWLSGRQCAQASSRCPIILRVSVGSKYGAQHSQDWTALTAHIPGLKVVFPATPSDAKGLMTSALDGTDPVVFFEIPEDLRHRRAVPSPTVFRPDTTRSGSAIPTSRSHGKDVTILTIGAVLYRALEAAKTLEEKYGISAEVIDARSIVPFDYTKVIESVKKTGKILIVGDACERNSVMKDMAANIQEFAFDYLDAPAVALGSRNWITPAHELEEALLPVSRCASSTLSTRSSFRSPDTPPLTTSPISRRSREQRRVSDS